MATSRNKDFFMAKLSDTQLAVLVAVDEGRVYKSSRGGRTRTYMDTDEPWAVPVQNRTLQVLLRHELIRLGPTPGRLLAPHYWELTSRASALLAEVGLGRHCEDRV